VEEEGQQLEEVAERLQDAMEEQQPEVVGGQALTRVVAAVLEKKARVMTGKSWEQMAQEVLR
jgi:hypothetical protein